MTGASASALTTFKHGPNIVSSAPCIMAHERTPFIRSCLQAAQALAALAHAEQASASRLLETCLENLSISAMQLGALSKSQDQAAAQSQVCQLQP